MVHILANTKADGAIVVRSYKEGCFEDSLLGSRSEDLEILKSRLVEVLGEVGSCYKQKYEKKLLKALGRGI